MHVMSFLVNRIKDMKLYHPQILAIEKHPYHFESIEDEPIFVANNPMCGDRFKLFDLNKNEPLGDMRFYGFGCSVSKASTSLFVELLEQKGARATLEIASSFIQYVQGVQQVAPLAQLEIFSSVREYPSRHDCVLLPWTSFLKYNR